MDAAQGLARTLADQIVTGFHLEPVQKLAVGRKDLPVLVQHHEQAAHGFEHGLDHWIGHGQRGQSSKALGIAAFRRSEIRVRATRCWLHPILPSDGPFRSAAVSSQGTIVFPVATLWN